MVLRQLFAEDERRLLWHSIRFGFIPVKSRRPCTRRPCAGSVLRTGTRPTGWCRHVPEERKKHRPDDRKERREVLEQSEVVREACNKSKLGIEADGDAVMGVFEHRWLNIHMYIRVHD